MSYQSLVKHVDPRKLAERGVQIKGSICAEQLPNLQKQLHNNEVDLEVTLDFGVDEQRLRTIKGKTTGQVFMTCQRCLEAVSIKAEAHLNLAIVLNNEQLKALPKRYDPLLLETAEVYLSTLVEEELILSLPSFPYHQDCEVNTSFGEEAISKTEITAANPFGMLQTLKDNTGNKPN